MEFGPPPVPRTGAGESIADDVHKQYGCPIPSHLQLRTALKTQLSMNLLGVISSFLCPRQNAKTIPTSATKKMDSPATIKSSCAAWHTQERGAAHSYQDIAALFTGKNGSCIHQSRMQHGEMRRAP